MKQVNDVEILFDAINETPDSYQEIVKHQDAIKSLERWPLIAAINQVEPLHAPILRATSSTLGPIKARVAIPFVEEFEAISVAETVLIKSQVQLPTSGNEVFQVNSATKKDNLLTNMPTNEDHIKPALNMNHEHIEFVADSRHSKRASDNISSIFERLRRS